jgi:hypothetical protein
VWPLWIIGNHEATVADGIIYVEGGHDYSPPLYKGAQIYAVNATSGQLIWSNLGFMTSGDLAISDGVMVGISSYDNQIYAYGMGRSATTVTAPATAIPLGTQVLIQGTVTDQSPGQTGLGIPAAGTPAIADQYQSLWSQYLWMQQPMPTNATGVPVTLTAVDPNHNTQNIGTVTSDITGKYAISWTPPVPGVYTITASFAGTNSYYSSKDETHIVVSAATAAAQPIQTPTITATPPPTATPTASPTVTITPVPPPSSAGIPTTYIVIAVIAVIVVVAAAALAFRRRK